MRPIPALLGKTGQGRRFSEMEKVCLWSIISVNVTCAKRILPSVIVRIAVLSTSILLEHRPEEPNS
jgi:hypothetical protein